MMQQDNRVGILCYSALLFVSLSFLVVAVAPKYRHTSHWLRSVCLLLAITALIWSALGFLSLFYAEHLTPHTRGYLFYWKSHVSGIAVGLLISLFLSPEFQQVSRIPSLFSRRRSVARPGLTNR